MAMIFLIILVTVFATVGFFVVLGDVLDRIAIWNLLRKIKKSKTRWVTVHVQKEDR